MNVEFLFFAAENAPDARDAYAGQLIPEAERYRAIQGFIPDPFDPKSEVRLDDTLVPPVLHLANALTSLHSGYSRTTGEFVKSPILIPPVTPRISGTYVGPRSILKMVLNTI